MAIILMDLPTEIIIDIYRYLNFKDIEAMSLTCRRFYEISKYKEFSQKVFLKLSKSDDIEYILSNDCFRDKFPQKVELCYIDDNKLLERFFHKYNKIIKELILHDSPINMEFVDSLQNLQNLEILQIKNYDFLLYFDLDFYKSNFEKFSMKIKSFTLKKCLLHSTAVLWFLSVFRNLECFSIRDCYGRGFSDTAIIFKNLPTTLNEFHICTPDIDRWRHDGGFFQDVRQVESLKHLKLKKLTYCSGNRLKDEDLLHLLNYQKHLLYLDLSNYLYITDESVLNIVETLKNLESLKLKRCPRLTDTSLIAISQLEKLKSLDISNCLNITSIGLVQGIAKCQNNVLEELSIANNKEIDESGILKCIQNCRNLRILDLQFCQVTNEIVQLIIRNLKNLKNLNLSHCSKVSDDGFINDDSKKSITQLTNMESSSSLKGLVFLDLDSCCDITDKTLIYGLQEKCLDLKVLNLRRSRVSKQGLIALHKNCPSIEQLTLSECQFVDNNALEVLLNNYGRLRVLNVRECPITYKNYEKLMNKITVLR